MRVWSRETGSAVPSCSSLLILSSQGDSYRSVLGALQSGRFKTPRVLLVYNIISYNSIVLTRILTCLFKTHFLLRHPPKHELSFLDAYRQVPNKCEGETSRVAGTPSKTFGGVSSSSANGVNDGHLSANRRSGVNVITLYRPGPEMISSKQTITLPRQVFENGQQSTRSSTSKTSVRNSKIGSHRDAGAPISEREQIERETTWRNKSASKIDASSPILFCTCTYQFCTGIQKSGGMVC